MKIIAAALVALVMTCPCAVAQRAPSREASPSRFYIFGEYYNYLDSGKFSGGGGGLGFNFNRYLGLQMGGQFLESAQPLGPNPSPAIVPNTVSAKSTLLYGEAKLSLPLTERLSLYGSAGGAYNDPSETVTLLTFSTPTTVTVNFSRPSTGYRIGLGAEYWFSRHWAVRASWHKHNIGGVRSVVGGGIAFRF